MIDFKNIVLPEVKLMVILVDKESPCECTLSPLFPPQTLASRYPTLPVFNSPSPDAKDTRKLSSASVSIISSHSRLSLKNISFVFFKRDISISRVRRKSLNNSSSDV